MALQDCQNLLDDAAARLNRIEALLMEATPAAVAQGAGHLEEVLSILPRFQQEIEALDSPVEARPMLARLDGFAMQVRRVERLIAQAGRFYEGWGRRLCAQAGYLRDGRVISMPQYAGAVRVNEWEG